MHKNNHFQTNEQMYHEYMERTVFKEIITGSSLSSSTVGEKLKIKLPGAEKWLIIEWKAI